MLSTQYITRPMSIVYGRNRSPSPMRKNMMAAASHGFHMFQAHTENLCLRGFGECRWGKRERKQNKRF